MVHALLGQVNVGGMGSIVGLNLSLLPWLLSVYEIPPSDHAMMMSVMMEINELVKKVSAEASKE